MTFEPMTAKKSLETLRDRPMRMIAVDIGNTAFKFGLFDIPALDALSASGTPFYYPYSMVDIRLLPKQLKVLPVWLSTFARSGGSEREPFFWFISSVNCAQTELLLETIRSRPQGDLVGFLRSGDIPIESKYSSPVSLGVDRKLAGLAASRRFGQKTPVLIADIGTASKIDLISENGDFLGGVILPGPDTALRSLSEKTEALPELKWSPKETNWNYPACSTADALRLGTSGGLLGTILYFYERALQTTEKKSMPIILTGGGAVGLEPFLVPLLHRFFPEKEHGPIWVRTVRDLILTGIELTRQLLR